MDRFKELTTFVEVAQRGSLSAAAREEGITPAMVGRRIDQLEERLGVKLFKRSTRKVTLTPEGTTFYEDCHRLLGELRSAEDALTIGAKNASGRLIVTAPTSFGRRHIAPHLPVFLAEHPNLAITLHLSERLVDLKNERFDLAIRIADLKAADLIAARLPRHPPAARPWRPPPPPRPGPRPPPGWSRAPPPTSSARASRARWPTSR